MDRHREHVRIPRLHLVTDDGVLLREDFLERAERALAAGGPALALHVRGPGLPGRLLYERARALAAPAVETGALLVVNGRVDVALCLPAAGVQLGEEALPVAEGRRLLGGGRRIGASVHGVARAKEAEREGADWLVVGTVFATRSHPDRPSGGTALVGAVTAATRVPALAIGGITPRRVAAVRGAGAHGVAALSGVWRRRDVAAAVGDYLEALDGGDS